MAVFVDALRRYPTEAIDPPARKYGDQWCHMGADTEDELLRAAARLKIPIRHIQDHHARFKPHFDLTPSRRAQAVKNGAEELGARAYIKRALVNESDYPAPTEGAGASAGEPQPNP